MKRKVEKQRLLLRVQEIAHQGDGIAVYDGHMYYIPHTAPEDEVEISVSQRNKKMSVELLDVLKPSPVRTSPPCPYYEKCGGCSLQHVTESFYKSWKLDRLEKEFSQFKLQPKQWGDPIFIPPHTRRRATFKARKLKGKIQLGFYKKRTHDFVPIPACLLLTDTLNQSLENFPAALRFILKEGGQQADIRITDTLSGLDICIVPEQQVLLNYEERESLADWARAHQVARLSIRWPEFTDTVCVLNEPVVMFGRVKAPVSAEGFLQASQESDRALAQLTIEALADLGNCQKVADLFCGRGTLTFPLAETYEVSGFEMDDEGLAVLSSLARQNKLPIQTIRRQLFEDPLKAEELNRFDAVVMDPPRAGALRQCEEIASSNVTRIVYVSCNPNTFARDAERLISGGYSFDKVTLVDQFVYSPHLEVVGIFNKK